MEQEVGFKGKTGTPDRDYQSVSFPFLPFFSYLIFITFIDHFFCLLVRLIIGKDFPRW